MKDCKFPEPCACLGCELDFAYNAYGHASETSWCGVSGRAHSTIWGRLRCRWVAFRGMFA